MKRIVQPELLDELPQTDPRAIRSRRDLQRVNFFMSNVGIVERLLRKSFPEQPPKQIAELGAGDGVFILEIARRFSDRWPNLEIILVDQQPVVSPETIKKIQQCGWRVKTIAADVFDWLSCCERTDCMMANLFLHHFKDEKLTELLRLASEKTNSFVACEPRRFAQGILGTRLLWMIGCNDVTRHDAAVSVRAGFNGNEISQQWPSSENWNIEEQPAGVFSHSFAAVKR